MTSIRMYFSNAKPALTPISHPHSVLLSVSVGVTEAYILKGWSRGPPKPERKDHFLLHAEEANASGGREDGFRALGEI